MGLSRRIGDLTLHPPKLSANEKTFEAILKYEGMRFHPLL